jgi:hypothetical protein
MFEFVIIGTCLQLNAANVALNTYAELPWCHPVWTWICTTSLLENPYPLSEAAGVGTDMCALNIPANDPWFDPYWCQPVEVDGVMTMTPCESEFVDWNSLPQAVQDDLYLTYVCNPAWLGC